MNVSRFRLRITLAACLLSATLSRGQDSPQKRLVFSGVVKGTQCREFPSRVFDLGPSGDRWRTKDDLNVRCDPIVGISNDVSEVTLTFIIDVAGPSSLGMRGKTFNFRWGKALAASFPSIRGQFSNKPDLCTKIAEILNSNALKMKPPFSERVHGPLEVSSTCDPDDEWGTSMEILLTGDLSEFPVAPNQSPAVRK